MTLGSSSDWPGRDPADGVDEVGALDLLEQVAGGAGHDRVEEGFVVGERREDEALDGAVERAHLAADLDAVAVGQAHVDDRDVGLRRGDAGDALGGGAGLADDLDVVLRLEQLPDPAADDLVVVQQEHPNRHGAPRSGTRG